MRYLLFPEEERRFLTELADDKRLTAIGRMDPRVVPDEIPVRPPLRLGALILEPYIFWAHEIGPLRRLGDREEPSDPSARVMMQLNRDADPLWQDAIDLERTPIILWDRPRWYDAGRDRIIPGRLASMGATKKTYPAEYLKLLREIESRLRKMGTKIDSWDFTGRDGDLIDGRQMPRPRDTRAFRVIASPLAMDWLRSGGRLYHWDA